MTNAFAVDERIPIEGFASIFVSVLGKPGVYALTDPLRDHLIAYVGQSTDIGCRYLDHVNLRSVMAEAKRRWTKDLLLVGLLPGLVVLEWGPEIDLLRREGYWIKSSRSCGLAWLNGPCGSPPAGEFTERTEKLLEQVRAWDGRRVLKRSASRSQEVLRIYKGILEMRAQHEKEKEERRRRDYAERTAAKQTKLFEKRVNDEVERRIGLQARELTSVARNLRVRVNNAARLGLHSVEAPEPRRP